MEAKHVFFGPRSPHHPSTPCSACSGSLAWPAGQSELSSLVLAHLLSLLVFSSRVLTSFLTCHMGLVVLFPTYLCPWSSPTKLLIVADQALLSLAPAHLSCLGFPGGSAGKASTCNGEDLGSIPGVGRFPWRRNGYPLQYSGLENSMDSIVHGGPKELDTSERLSLTHSLTSLTHLPELSTIWPTTTQKLTKLVPILAFSLPSARETLLFLLFSFFLANADLSFRPWLSTHLLQGGSLILRLGQVLG